MRGWATAVRNRNLVLLLGGNFVSSTGTHVQQAVVAWLLYRETGSSTLVGVLVVALQGPALLLTVPAGVVADRYDRRTVLLAVQSVMMASAVAMAVLVGVGAESTLSLIALTAVLGAGNAVLGPSWIAELAVHVPPEAVFAAYSLNSVSFHSAVMLGPPLGAVLLEAAGPLLPIVLNAASFAAVLAAIVALPAGALPVAARAPIRRSLAEALEFTRRSDRARRLLPLSAAVAAVMGGLPALMPAFASTVLGTGAAGYGQLLGALGFGSLLGGVVLGIVPPAVSRRGLMQAAVWAAAAGAGLLAVSSSLPAAMAALTLVGGGGLTLLVCARTVVQMDAPSELQGRAVSVWFTVSFGATPVGGLLLGGAADSLGASTVAAAVAVYLVVLAVVTSVLARTHRGIVVPYDSAAAA